MFTENKNEPKSTALNAISLPLNQVNLIEASAGTGKPIPLVLSIFVYFYRLVRIVFLVR